MAVVLSSARRILAHVTSAMRPAYEAAIETGLPREKDGLGYEMAPEHVDAYFALKHASANMGYYSQALSQPKEFLLDALQFANAARNTLAHEKRGGVDRNLTCEMSKFCLSDDRMRRLMSGVLQAHRSIRSAEQQLSAPCLNLQLPPNKHLRAPNSLELGEFLKDSFGMAGRIAAATQVHFAQDRHWAVARTLFLGSSGTGVKCHMFLSISG